MVKVFDLSSLSGKITSAYITLAMCTVVLGIIAISDILFLERQVAERVVVSDLKDAVKEMRLEEKNLFLYAVDDSLIRADTHAATALKISQDYQLVLERILSEKEVQVLIITLKSYQLKLTGLNSVAANQRKLQQQEIRNLGHQILLSVEAISNEESRVLKEAVRESLWFLVIPLFIIGFSIYVIGRKLKRVVVEPIQQLESSMMPIARGKFDHLDPPSEDREFITFTDAFNRMLKELETHQKRMLQSEKLASLGILASGVAHELNNPLSNISSSCQLLIEELTDADPVLLNKWLQQIDSETQRGRNIVRTMLDFGSQRVFQKKSIYLLNLIKETQIIMGKTLQQSSAQLSVNVKSDLCLNVDKQRIQQLLINLFQNALHAGGKGVNLRISATVSDKGVSMVPVDAEMAGDIKCISNYDGSFVEILVADDGPGISSESLAKVFDPFFTTSEPGRGDGHGTGLGLYIVQEIVREHDGCLAISSQQGKGTQVIILLPVEGST